MDVELAADAGGVVRGLRARVVSDNGAHHVYPLTAALEPLGTRVDPAGALSRRGLRVRGAGGADAQAAARRLSRRGHDDGRVRDGAPARPGSPSAWASIRPRSAGATSSRATAYPFDVGERDDATTAAISPRRSSRRSAWPDYEALRREQAAARAAGRLVGVGVACYTEYTGMGSDVFRRRGMEDVPRRGGGHGHHGSRRQRPLRDELPLAGAGARDDDRAGRRRPARRRAGARARRAGRHRGRRRPAAAPSAAAARCRSAARVAVAADRVRARLAALAGHRLEAAAADIVLEAGRAHVRGFPDRARRGRRAGAAGVLAARGAACRPSWAPGSSATVYFDPPGPTFSGAVHVALVEIDRETGRVARAAATSWWRTAGPS